MLSVYCRGGDVMLEESYGLIPLISRYHSLTLCSVMVVMMISNDDLGVLRAELSGWVGLNDNDGSGVRNVCVGIPVSLAACATTASQNSTQPHT